MHAILALFLLQAEQFDVVDVTYTHSPQTTMDSHYSPTMLPGVPRNWRTPIDYASGTAYMYLEVFTKPSDARTVFSVCFLGTPSYACTGFSPAYTRPGFVKWSAPFFRFYQYDRVDWSKGVTRGVALILKTPDNVKPAPENVGAATAALYMPTMVRMVVSIVSPGGTYTAPGAPRDAGAKLDAKVAADAGSDLSWLRPDVSRPVGADGGPTPDDGPPAPDEDEVLDPPTNSKASGGCSVASRGDAPLPAILLIAAFAYAFARSRRPG